MSRQTTSACHYTANPVAPRGRCTLADGSPATNLNIALAEHVGRVWREDAGQCPLSVIPRRPAAGLPQSSVGRRALSAALNGPGPASLVLSARGDADRQPASQCVKRHAPLF